MVIYYKLKFVSSISDTDYLNLICCCTDTSWLCSPDAFPPEALAGLRRASANGLGLLPYGNGVHYDSEKRRRPAVHRLVREGVFDLVHCTDDGVGLVYHGTELVEAVAEVDGKGAYVVTQDARGEVSEQRLEPRRLPDPAR